MDPLRLYLLAGLLAHKAVWEVMKRGSAPPKPSGSPGAFTLVVKAVKMAVLAGIIAQTFLPDVLPLLSDPAPLRAAGALLFTAGLAVALLGRLQLGRNWSDIETAVVRSEHRVISEGVYRYIRHPIYTGDILLLAGLELALNSWLVLGVAPLIAAVARQAAREEESLARRLPGYDAYRRRTKRFIPFLA